MQPKLTVQERLKDLRVVDFDLTLEELAERTGLSRSALGKYESDENAKACLNPRWENTKPTISRTSARSAWWSWRSSTGCPPITCWG